MVESHLYIIRIKLHIHITVTAVSKGTFKQHVIEMLNSYR